MILKTGDVFRRFRVLGTAGQGGMGIVYQAHDTKLGRDVALKFVTQAGAYNSEFCDRLRREARSLAALTHPNIVTIHDIDEVEGVPFLVLEWVDGKALSDGSFVRSLSIEEFCRIALPVADALASAHDRGIIHRDVKPANVLISNDGGIKVVDFGIAKFRDFDLDVIATAGTVGTVAYMSPEQASGTDLSPASDIFSFGIVAFELLTGKRPFEGQGPGSVLSAIMSGSHSPLSELRRDLPDQLIAIVERCLENEPARRFQSGRELAYALRQLTATDSLNAGEALTMLSPVAYSSITRHQDIRFCVTADGVHLAYSVVGNGPPLVRVLGHFTHLEMEWEWPDLRHFWERLAETYTVIRYDGRGIGLSDRYAGEFTEETRQLDLDAVVRAVAAENAILLGISEGGWTAAIYANQHPEQISYLVLYGAYCRGARARPGYDAEEEQALITLIRKGWGRDTPRFRQVFTGQFFHPDADPKLIAHFNEMQRASADPETAARYHESCHARADGRDLFKQLRIPTLVVHCRDDMAVSADEGRLLASLIPGAQLVLLPSGMHYFPTDREAVVRVVGAINRFVDGVRAE
ncbi:MAG TPA: alpha/beta fold hydrolase [Pyrinomonadaceae bacterium]|nr:alpha/beta fold hydrolase [Pyrinomonadaceae bacterium]